jgi:C-terminal processing protease CtpA/Prc
MGSFGLWLSRGTQSNAVPREEHDSGKAVHGSRVGVGLVMEVDENSGNIYISDLILNSAAWHSSLCIGDRITHIDNVPVKGKLATAVNDLLLGAEGSVLELRVEARAVADGGKVISLIFLRFQWHLILAR